MGLNLAGTAFLAAAAGIGIAVGSYQFDQLRNSFPESGTMTFSADGRVGSYVAESEVFKGRRFTENLQGLLIVTFNENGIPTTACRQNIYQIAGAYDFTSDNPGLSRLLSQYPDIERDSDFLNAAARFMQDKHFWDRSVIQLKPDCVAVNSTTYPDEIYKLKERRSEQFPNLS